MITSIKINMLKNKGTLLLFTLACFSTYLIGRTSCDCDIQEGYILAHPVDTLAWTKEKVLIRDANNIYITFKPMEK